MTTAADGSSSNQTAAKDAAGAKEEGEEEEDFSDIESFGVLSTAGVDRLSRPVFVFYACNLPKRDYGLHDKMLRLRTVKDCGGKGEGRSGRGKGGRGK